MTGILNFTSEPSRAQALAIVVASPTLLAPRCRTIEEMRLVNLLCRLRHYAEESAGRRQDR
jgi:hypothetical protein